MPRRFAPRNDVGGGAVVFGGNAKTAIEIIEAYDTIIEKGHIITDGSHISQSGLQPNVFYQTGEHSYIYQTNGDGLISKVYVKKLE